MVEVDRVEVTFYRGHGVHQQQGVVQEEEQMQEEMDKVKDVKGDKKEIKDMEEKYEGLVGGGQG